MLNKEMRDSSSDRSVMLQGDAWARAFIESAVDGIIAINERGIIEYFNPAAQRMFGYAPEEIIGQNINTLMPSPYREAHDGYLQRYTAGGESTVIGRGREVIALRRTGETFPAYLSVCETHVNHHRIFVGNVHDLGPLREASEAREAALHSLNKRNMELRGLFYVGEVLRYKHDVTEALKHVVDLVKSACHDPESASVRVQLEDLVFTSVLFHEGPNVLSMPIIAAERKRGIIQLFYSHEPPNSDDGLSIKEEKDLLLALARMLGDTIERQEAEAQVIQASQLASIGELAAGVSHEINNPVNGILNCADILLSKLPSNSKEHQYAGLIRTECERITKIVGSLLTFAGQHHEEWKLAKVADIVDAVLSLSRKKMAKSHIDLRVDIDHDLPDITCRAEQLQQVVMNLIINAMHALDARFPARHPDKKLSILGRTIRKQGADFVRLTVADQGVGIAAVHMDRIFDPFFTTKGRDKGTGLGLSVSSGIVHEHGGTITVESELSKGAQFHLDLPIDGGRPASRPVQEI